MITLKKLTPAERIELVDAAAGRAPVDLLMSNLSIVNVLSGEIYAGRIGIKHGYIAYALSEDEPLLLEDAAAEHFDAGGAYAVPGLIDAHVHIESSMLTPPFFARIVIPKGTTTVVTDPHEIGNVLGIAGVEYMVEAGRNVPMYQLALAPSCVPAVPGLEEAGAVFGAEEIASLLEHERVIGIAEVMDYVGACNNDRRMREILDLGLEKGCFIQGHYFGNSGHELAAYLCSGATSNHEIFSPEAALAALRNGMIIDARDSSFSRNIAAITSAVAHLGRVPNFTLCTDDRESEEIVSNGHVNDCVRSAIASGLEPIQALRAATCNPAALYGLERLGAIAPGYIANIAIIDSIASMQVQDVFFEGRHVAADGEMLVAMEPETHPVTALNSVHIDTLDSGTFRLKAPVISGDVAVRVIAYEDMESTITNDLIMRLPVQDGYVSLEGSDNLAFITVINRHAGKTGHTTAVVKNFHLTAGALAGTVSHDCHNLTVVYQDPEEALRAAEKVAKAGGGVLYIEEERELLLELPVAGLMNNIPAEALIARITALNEMLRKRGIGSRNPVMRLATAALPVIPHIRITDKGIVDVNAADFLPLFPEHAG